MKHLFIVNPVAGGRDATESVRSKVMKAFEKRSDNYEIYVTKAAMDAPKKIKREAEKGERLRVYACGGDGTFNECVCGAAELENVAVCPFPTGTGNDFCRMFGSEGELFRNIDAVLDGGETRIDLINCNGRWCANICSVGIDARIGTDVHKYSGLPLIGGSGGYIVSAIVNMFKGISSKMRVVCGSFISEGYHTLVCVCNGRFYGGGFNPSLSARPDDGMLDIIVAKKTNLLQFAALIGKYAKGKAAELPKYCSFLRGTKLHIDCGENNAVNVDGEVIYGKKIDIELIPHALSLIVPKGMRFFDNAV